MKKFFISTIIALNGQVHTFILKTNNLYLNKFFPYILLTNLLPFPFALSFLRRPLRKKLNLSLSGYGVPATIFRLCGVKIVSKGMIIFLNFFCKHGSFYFFSKLFLTFYLPFDTFCTARLCKTLRANGGRI